MKLSDLGLPKDRENFIREICILYNAQRLQTVDFTFDELRRMKNGLLETKDKSTSTK